MNSAILAEKCEYEVKALALREFEKRQKVFGKENLDTLEFAHRLATWLLEQEDLQDALLLARKTLESKKKVRCQKHLWTAAWHRV